MLKTIKNLFKRNKKQLTFTEYTNNIELENRRILKDTEIPEMAEHKPLFIVGNCKLRTYKIIPEPYTVIYSSEPKKGFAIIPINYEQERVV